MYHFLSFLHYIMLILANQKLLVFFFFSFDISLEFLSLCDTISGLVHDAVLLVSFIIKSAVASAVFWIYIFEAILNASLPDWLP